MLLLFSVAVIRIHGQYCLPIFSGAGEDAWLLRDPYLAREGRPDLFKYGPIWAIVFAPLFSLGALVGESGLQFFWAFLNLLAFSGAVLVMIRRWNRQVELQPRWRKIVMLVLLLPLALTNAFYGQINSVLLLLIVIGLAGSSGGVLPRHAFFGGMALAFAAWMKLFPFLFAIFLVLPMERQDQRNRRAGLSGFVFGILLGVVLPLAVWRGDVVDIFRSWAQVLGHDLHSPHLKIGLASLLPEGARSLLRPIQLIYFGGLMWGVFWVDRYSRPDDLLHRSLWRRSIENLLILGVLLLSHMTEPPTLALLAPPVIWLAIEGGGAEIAVFVVLMVLLPSDLIPRNWKGVLGGQYAIKTFALLWILAVVSRRCLQAACRDSRAGVPGSS
jgi:hypothetical protein